MGKSAVRGNYYENLEIIRAASLKHKVPFWSLRPDLPHRPVPQPDRSGDPVSRFSRTWSTARRARSAHLLDPGGCQLELRDHDLDGSRTEPYYEQVKRVNAKLKGWGPVLLKLTSGRGVPCG